MPHQRLHSSSNALKQRLLTGASAAVIVLALSVATPTGVMAEEIFGNDETSANLLAPGNDIISGTVGGQFGAIDVDANVTYNSITLTESETISVFDGNGAGNVASITNDFVIASSASGTLVFARSNAGGVAGHANLEISGNLEGLNNSRGGDLAISAFDQSNNNASQFHVRGSTYMGALTVRAGDAVAADAGDISAGFGFGSNNDTFDAFGLTVTGGNGIAAFEGGQASSSVSVDGNGSSTAIFGAGGIIVTAGNGGTDGNGGLSRLTVVGNATIDGAVTITGGDEGTGTGDGGDATLDFSENDGTVTFANALTIATGMDTGTGGNAGNAEATFASITVNANGGVVLSEQQNATATLTLYGNSDQTFNGIITAANDGDGEIFVNNANGAADTIRFSDTIGTDARRIGTIDIEHDDTVVFQGNVFANTLNIANFATAQFEGTTSILGSIGADGQVIIGNGTTAATLTVQGDADQDGTTINSFGTLIIDADGADVTVAGAVDAATGATITTLQTTGGNLITFDVGVGLIQPITLIDLDADTNFDEGVVAQTLDVDTGVIATTSRLQRIQFSNISGGGTLLLTNTANLLLGASGESSTVSIANLNGLADNSGSIRIDDGAMVTIETTIGNGNTIDSFTTGRSDDTVLTINSGTMNGGDTAITGSSSIGLTLGAGTIVLGSNIGDGDTVFSFTNNTPLVTTANETTTVQLSANFLETGDVITLAETNADQTAALDEADFDTQGQLVVTQTALTEYTLSVENGAGIAGGNDDIIITATARSASDTADELGVSEEDAVAIRRAVESTDATGDDEGLDELTTVLNADDDGASAAQAARTVGTQEDTLGGASEASFQTFGEMFDAITDRLQGGHSGFSGGDLDGPYSLQASSSTRGVWGQVFGGVTTADSDSTFAGYDAAYGGMMVGIDGNITEDFTIGAFGSYTFSTVDGDGAGSAQIDANTFGFGVYAGYEGESFYLDGFAAYALSQNDLTRQDILNRAISADYDASQFSVGLAGGVPIEVSTNVFITPNAGLTYNRYEADSYTETGSPLAQTVDPDAVSNLTGTIGARIHAVYENFDNDGTVFIPELRVALIGDLMDDDATASATFAGAGVASYQVTGTDTDDIGALIGFGLGLDNPDWAASLSYDADLRSDYMSHTARAEFRWKF